MQLSVPTENDSSSMANSSQHPRVHALSFVSPETFELTLRRLMQPTAEEKMKEALDQVTREIAEAQRSPLAELRARHRKEEQLRKKREKLERRLAKLQELKSKAAGPLVGGLFLAGIVWVIVVAATGTGVSFGVSSLSAAVQEGLKKDMEGIEERKGTGLTIEELEGNVSVGQRMGLAGGPRDENGMWQKDANDKWYPPDFLTEIVAWTPELAGCDETLSAIAYDGVMAGCHAAARIDVVKADDPAIAMSCVFLQLGTEYGRDPATSIGAQNSFGEAATFIRDPAPAERIVRFWVQDPQNKWDETMMLFCQAFGTNDAEIIKGMASSVAQIGIRVDAGAYIAGGIFTWLEADGSYAPAGVWEGHGPSSR